MNEQIKELAEQATTTFDFGAPINFFDKERFAELIVKECAKVAMDNDMTDTGVSSDAILKHFGVK